MGKLSRDKGANAERAVASMLQPIWPGARRRCSGEESQDAVRGRDIDGVPGWAIQVTCSAAPRIEKKLLEAVGVALPGERPIAITRRSSRSKSGQFLVTMRLEDMLDLFRMAQLTDSRREGP